MSGPLQPPGRPRGALVGLTTAQREALGGPVVVLPTVEDTRAFGARLASVLRAGDLVVLTGPLGAGKTALVQGIGAGLHVRGNVVSPTFVIARIHRGALPLVHVDAYRLGSLAEVDDLDLDVDTADAVTVVEWGTGLVEQLADARLEVSIARAPDSEERTARLMPRGGDWAARVAALAEYAG
ncbi:MAG: tRNA threonylcarbamoyladenosine biosynthesis protein TsaE [Pseudonocardiales bacterium]|nr:tRNA threonylcarbamoyladenosine biosynthesis protein TsaE [Pseudonocardiales bacterium]